MLEDGGYRLLRKNPEDGDSKESPSIGEKVKLAFDGADQNALCKVFL